MVFAVFSSCRKHDTALLLALPCTSSAAARAPRPGSRPAPPRLIPAVGAHTSRSLTQSTATAVARAGRTASTSAFHVQSQVRASYWKETKPSRKWVYKMKLLGFSSVWHTGERTTENTHDHKLHNLSAPQLLASWMNGLLLYSLL